MNLYNFFRDVFTFRWMWAFSNTPGHEVGWNEFGRSMASGWKHPPLECVCLWCVYSVKTTTKSWYSIFPAMTRISRCFMRNLWTLVLSWQSIFQEWIKMAGESAHIFGSPLGLTTLIGKRKATRISNQVEDLRLEIRIQSLCRMKLPVWHSPKPSSPFWSAAYVLTLLHHGFSCELSKENSHAGEDRVRWVGYFVARMWAMHIEACIMTMCCLKSSPFVPYVLETVCP